MTHTVKIMNKIQMMGYGLLVMGALLVSAPAIAQFSNDQYGVQAPGSQSFQSTSSMTGSGSNYSSNPSIGNDGVASAPAARAVSGRRNDGEGNPFGPGTLPDNPLEPGTPVGDALWPLLMAAGAFLLMKALRRRRAE